MYYNVLNVLYNSKHNNINYNIFFIMILSRNIFCSKKHISFHISLRIHMYLQHLVQKL